MNILLLGEYSNVHNGLAQGLRALGHKVCVVSNGDFWKNYPRDIDLSRNPHNPFGGIAYYLRLRALLPRLRGFDVVQLINPMFLELKAERIAPIYRALRRHNKRVFLDAYGMDYYWVKGCTLTPRLFRYSDFNIGDSPIDNPVTRAEAADWTETAKGRLNRMIAADCDGIVAGMYEYYECYRKEFSEKCTYIPFPIDAASIAPITGSIDGKIRFFIGIQKSRSQYKGTDIMLRALQRIAQKYPKCTIINKAESVPFDQYRQLIRGSDVLLDQLYGYSPGMNALLAMASGQVVVGGGEPECYELLHEQELRPMICVQPNEDDVYSKLEQLILNADQLGNLQEQSRQYVLKHHNPAKVAEQYLEFWGKSLK